MDKVCPARGRFGRRASRTDSVEGFGRLPRSGRSRRSRNRTPRRSGSGRSFVSGRDVILLMDAGGVGFEHRIDWFR